jgi:glutathione S-transferase
VLIESSAILDAIDEQVGPDRALLPRSGPARRDGLRVVGLATGLADKAVSLFYESFFRPSPSDHWIRRCKNQIAETLDALDTDRSRRTTDWWLGNELSHADIAVACALAFAREAHPELFEAARWPAVARHAAATDALEEFRAIYQPFTVTRGD